VIQISRVEGMHSSQIKYTQISILLVAILGLVLYWFTSWNPFLVWIITLSIITFVFYGYDKGQAKIDGSRVPEVVLHGLALAGGFLGGWLGRWFFRHKTRKRFFFLVLLIATILYTLLVYFLFLR